MHLQTAQAAAGMPCNVRYASCNSSAISDCVAEHGLLYVQCIAHWYMQMQKFSTRGQILAIAVYVHSHAHKGALVDTYIQRFEQTG